MNSLKLADRSLHSSVPLYAAVGHNTTEGIDVVGEHDAESFRGSYLCRIIPC